MASLLAEQIADLGDHGGGDEQVIGCCFQ